ncbi:MAG: hypothetical protein ABSF13_11120 [Smithella sp.]
MFICCVALHPSPAFAGAGYTTYEKVGLIPQALRALPLEHFTKPPTFG